YKLKNPLMRVYYNYWYAGGVPIAGSEEVCLRLIEWGQKQGLKLGLHYCSLENKFSGQIYQNNKAFEHNETSDTYYMSKRDYFLKSAKVFGEDAAVAKAIFIARKAMLGVIEEKEYLEFPVRNIPLLKTQAPDMEIGITYCTVERREEGDVLRELRVDVTTPKTFGFGDL
ncbi:MAG: radical SAM protein, partial [Eggerthellaceae bacterium]|nr:radical SAM protein [Eggerthellaceae bacterium]